MVLAYSYLRFSSAEQRKGHSRKRQEELRDEWLKRHPDVTLDLSLKLEDLAVSAFRGKNATEGDLAAFLEAVKIGKVKPGSYLIVENLDRLSRDEIEEAMILFLSIMKAGIIIVTLKPEREFRKGANQFQVMEALVEFTRAHSESVTKSGRAYANWNKRRKNLAEELLTRQIPGWLIPKDGQAVLDEAKAAVVRRMFELCLNGYGANAIAALLNKEEVPHYSRNPRSKVWRACTVYRTLTDRSCIGEFQPMTTNDMGKRVPAGAPEKNRFPAVVPPGVFDRVQEAIAGRSKGVGGSQDGGWKCTNVFRGLVQTETGAVYIYRYNVDKKGRVYTYLILKQHGEKSPNIPYKVFEQQILSWLGKDVKIEMSQGELDLAALRAREGDLVRRIETIKQKIKELAIDSLFDTLKELEDELKAIRHQVEKAELPKQDHTSQTRTAIKLLRENPEDESARRLVKQQIRNVVKRIVVEEITGKLLARTRTYQFRVELVDGKVYRLSYTADTRGNVTKPSIEVEDVKITLTTDEEMKKGREGWPKLGLLGD